jgi:hypothetical protein
MIAEIRSYLKGVVRAENSDLKVISNPVTDEMADTVLEDSFFIGIGNMTTALQDTTIMSDVAVIVNIYKAGDSDSIDDYDKGYCEAIDIQANAMFKENIDQTNSIKNVVSSGIEIETINNNDNMFKFSIQFTVTVCYVHEK